MNHWMFLNLYIVIDMHGILQVLVGGPGYEKKSGPNWAHLVPILAQNGVFCHYGNLGSYDYSDIAHFDF